MNDIFGGRKIVIKALVGSHNYNLNTSLSDKDFKFFVAPTFDDLFDGKMFSNGKQSVDVDFTVHDVRKLGDLLWKANINFIEVLFSQDLEFDPSLSWIFENADNLALMNPSGFARATFGMHLEKMKNLFKGTETTKPLVEKFGFDTKEAMHALRCLLVLERVAKTGSMRDALFFRNNEFERLILLDLKAGNTSLELFNYQVEFWKANFKDEVMNWFDSQSPNLELKEELDNVIKEFVRHRIMRR